MVRLACALAILALAWAGCVRPRWPERTTKVRRSCAVSYDGWIWYRVPAGTFSPIDARFTQCGSFALARSFVRRPPAMGDSERSDASALRGRVVTATFLDFRNARARTHRVAVFDSDDLDGGATCGGWVLPIIINVFTLATATMSRPNISQVCTMGCARALPWYVPDGQRRWCGEKNAISCAQRPSESAAFWGIAWNSDGIDGTFDRGRAVGRVLCRSAFVQASRSIIVVRQRLRSNGPRAILRVRT